LTQWGSISILPDLVFKEVFFCSMQSEEASSKEIIRS
jgi:hypothetical protein